MGPHWPEFKSFLGCFSLTTGVRFTATAALIEHVMSIYINCRLLASRLYSPDEVIYNKISEYRQNVSTDYVDNVMGWDGISLSSLLTWIVIKCMVFFTVFLLFYGAWKKKPKMYKIYLNINVPYWTLCAVYVIIKICFVNIWLIVIYLTILFFGALSLLIIRSALREITGKQILLNNNVLDPSNCNICREQYHNSTTSKTVNTSIEKHCSTCTCSNTFNQDSLYGNGICDPVLQSSSSPPQRPQLYLSLTPNNEEAMNTKDLNFKEAPTIYDPSQLQGLGNATFDDPPNQCNSKKFNEADTKKCMDDIPIIFDQNQLRARTSPIFENVDITNDGNRY